MLHIVLWSVLGTGVFFYAATMNELLFLKILGSTEKDLSLPVFAQFIVTQTFDFSRPFSASEIALPLYLPSDPLPIKISLFQEDRLITWWQYPFPDAPRSEGRAVAHLRFIAPTILQGKSELRFDGSSITHDEQNRAPRLFTETFDAAYPDGNYRIARNEKQGDIAMQIMEQKTNSQLFSDKIHVDPLGNFSFVLICSSLLVALALLPSALLRAGKKLQRLIRSL